MTRTLEEWIGANDDSTIPARVKIRVFDNYTGECNICFRNIRGKLTAAYDHRIALINGGKNRESNIQLLCCECHAGKTKADVAEKSRIHRKRSKHIGATSPKRKPFPGSRASGLRKRMDGTVERR